MSGYIVRNPLMTDEPQFGPPPVVAGRPVLPNALAMPAGDWRDTIAPQPTQADAADATAQAYRAFQERDRAEQVRLGYVDPATGQLTPEGWRAQAQTIGGGFGPADVGMAGGFGGLIKNYHGSPHLFPPTPKNPLGEFNPAKIGTGEGNQAFGVGAGYTAGAEGTALRYKADLSGDPLIDGRPVDWTNPAEHAAALVYGEGSHRQAVRALGTDVRYYDSIKSQTPDAQNARRAYDYLVAGGDLPQIQKPGHMYEVNIHAEPEDFLHWDKPLSEQNPKVQALFPIADDGRAILPNGERADPAKLRGESLYRSLAEAHSGDQAAASQAMQDAGIAGIRYLDAQSRSQGKGTYNHVVFDPEKMEIVRRFGIAGLIGGGAAATAAGGNQGQNQ